MSFSSVKPLLRAVPRLSALKAPAFRQSIRNASTAAAGSKGKTGIVLLGVGAAAIGSGSFYFFGGKQDLTAVKDAAMPEQVDYQAVYNAIADALDSEDYDDGSYGPVLVRLAWHCSGSYDKESNSGGSNGATMRFAPEANLGANAGLQHAREKLEPIKKMFPQITYSDLWTLAGVVAIQEMGGPYINWRAGRKDGDVAGCSPDGRLPDGDKGADHIRSIFYRMGFSDQEIVALSGAHALGRCHTDRSGFENAWSFSPTTMTNDYFKLLLSEKWSLRKWKGPIQYEDVKTKSIMMLTTDHSLITDKVFKPITTLYAKDEAKFFSDFAAAFTKLIELGVPATQFSEIVTLRKTEDQEKIKA